MKDKIFTQDEINNTSRRYNIAHLNNDEYCAEIQTADQIKPMAQPWFWNNIIPLDTTTLFAGFGNSGKSQLLIFMAAHTSNGKVFKAGGLEHSFPKGSVIILSGEDDFQYQLVPRLIAADADLKSIHLLKMMKTPGKPKALLDLDAHLSLLEKTIDNINISENKVKLIVIDPVQYFTGEMKDHINANVCRFIASLNDLAKKYNLSIIMNKHLRKKGGGDGISTAVDSVSGSGAWTTSPRSCWLIQRHPEKEGVILFADLKGNLKAKETKSLAYRIDQFIIPDSKINTTAMKWLDELEDFDADQALNFATIPPMEKAIRQWIIDFLLECNKKPNNGAMFVASELYGAVLQAGFKRKSYYKAKDRMLEDGILKEVAEGKIKTIMIKLSDPESYTQSHNFSVTGGEGERGE